jgi:hypothetical protein
MERIQNSKCEEGYLEIIIMVYSPQGSILF